MELDINDMNNRFGFLIASFYLCHWKTKIKEIKWYKNYATRTTETCMYA